MLMTKQEFVDLTERAARMAFENYDRVVEYCGYEGQEARDLSIEEIVESATCWAGIGSCGGGGCKH